jgi:uncharacterized RDD family membrane protein YckC
LPPSPAFPTLLLLGDLMIEKKYKTFWRRFFAIIIDVLVLVPITMLLENISQTTGVQFFSWFNNFTIYAYTIILHGLYGQTLGKYILRVKVLTLSETKISFKNAFLRDAIPLLLTFIIVGYMFIYFGPLLSSFDSNEMPSEQQLMEVMLQMQKTFLPMMILTLMHNAWILLELITMLTNNKRRAIHDFIAGTVVVKKIYIKDLKSQKARDTQIISPPLQSGGSRSHMDIKKSHLNRSGEAKAISSEIDLELLNIANKLGLSIKKESAGYAILKDSDQIRFVFDIEQLKSFLSNYGEAIKNE